MEYLKGIKESLKEVGGRAHMHLAPGHCRKTESTEVKGATHYDVGDFMDLEADACGRLQWESLSAGRMAAPGACPVRAIDESRRKAAENIWSHI